MKYNCPVNKIKENYIRAINLKLENFETDLLKFLDNSTVQTKIKEMSTKQILNFPMYLLEATIDKSYIDIINYLMGQTIQIKLPVKENLEYKKFFNTEFKLTSDRIAKRITDKIRSISNSDQDLPNDIFAIQFGIY